MGCIVKSKYLSAAHPVRKACDALTRLSLPVIVGAFLILSTSSGAMAQMTYDQCIAQKNIPARYCKTWADDAKKVKQPKETKECLADKRIANKWLGGEGTKSYFKATATLLTKWAADIEKAKAWDTEKKTSVTDKANYTETNPQVPLSRFLPDDVDLEEATEAQVSTAIKDRKAAFDKFQKFALDLRDLAQDAAIKTTRVCQNCNAIKDWSYLGYIAAEGMREVGIEKSNFRGQLEIDGNKAELVGATVEGIRLVSSHIAGFKNLIPAYKTAKSENPDNFLAISKLVCGEAGNAKADCYAKVINKCAEKGYAGSSTYCTKGMIKDDATTALNAIIANLNSDEAKTGTPLKDLDHKLCKSDDSNYFGVIRNHRFHTGVR